MKIAGRFVEVSGNATLPPRVKHPGRQRESFKERGQTIHNETIRYIEGTQENIKYRLIVTDASGIHPEMS